MDIFQMVSAKSVFGYVDTMVTAPEILGTSLARAILPCAKTSLQFFSKVQKNDKVPKYVRL
jgi:hypothetical protein